MFRKRFDTILQAAAIPLQTFLPSSFRPGGATALFQASGENVLKLQWRGRWQNVKMLERYVQELQAMDVWGSLSADALFRISSLAPLGMQLVEEATFADFWCCGI